MRFTAAALSFLIAAAAPAWAQTDPLHRALDAYALYQSDISALLDADITNEAALDSALELAARHEPARVARGWIAYGALSAAQSPAFVRGVRSRVTAAGRAPVLRQLRNDVTYARRRPPGASEAVQIILNATDADSARFTLVAARYDALGDALDARGWAGMTDRGGARTERLRVMRPERVSSEARLHIAVLGAAPLSDADAFGGRRFWDALARRNSPRSPQRALRERYAGGTDHMLTLAALFIVGATESEDARVTAMLDDPHLQQCLALEQLQFRQCASVAHDANEDTMCLAQHGLARPGACFANLVAN
jgi:hypothetical protein